MKNKLLKFDMRKNSNHKTCKDFAYIPSIKNYLSLLLFIFITIVLINNASAQNNIDGTYNSKKRTFEAVDKNYQIEKFREDLATYRLNNKCGVIDTTGNIIMKPVYDEIDVFLDGVARVMINTDYPPLYGFIDKKGNEIVPVKHTDTDDFFYRSMRFSNFLVVGINNKYACYDNKTSSIRYNKSYRYL
jgi:hypothetical protein